MHVKALSKNEMLPAVKISLFGAVRRIVSSEAFASLLLGFEEIAVVLFAIFARREIKRSESDEKKY